jgi:hypothetical protein
LRSSRYQPLLQALIMFSEQRYPALRALLAQLLAAGLVVGLLLALAKLTAWRPSLWAVAVMQGFAAAGLGFRFGLSRWWLPINLFFVPALLAMYALSLPAWAYAGLFFAILLFNWNSFGERVPLYLSGEPTERVLGQLLEDIGRPVTFVDLGCGLGGTIVRLSRRFPESRFEGVETAPLSFVYAWLRSFLRSNCRVRYRNLWREDLSRFDVVYCFLSPAPMGRLWRKASSEMRLGSRLVSNSFAVPDVPPSSVVSVKDWRDTRLLIWEMGEPTRGETARHPTMRS